MRTLLGLILLSCTALTARAQLFISSNGGGNIGEFNLSTGAAINRYLLTGLSNPAGLAVSGNALFVTTEPSQGAGTVVQYTWNGTTATNPTTILTGLNSPAGLTLSGTTLYVVDNLGGSISAYNISGSSPSLLYSIGTAYPMSVAVSGSTLFVADLYASPGDTNTGSIHAYNATNGASLGTVATGLYDPTALAVSGSTLFAATEKNNSVASFTISGFTLTNENASFATGFGSPVSLAAVGNELFVGQTNDIGYGSNGSVALLNATTGAVINSAFVGQYNGINYPAELAVSAVPEPPFAPLAAGAAILGLAGLLRLRGRTAQEPR